MLPPENRLKKKTDIKNVFKAGRGLKEDFLILKIARNSLNKVRFGFIVSKKVSNKATIRNQIKRRLRESVWLNFKKIIAAADYKKKGKGFDGLFIAVPGLETKDFWELDEIVNNIFIKIETWTF